MRCFLKLKNIGSSAKHDWEVGETEGFHPMIPRSTGWFPEFFYPDWRDPICKACVYGSLCTWRIRRIHPWRVCPIRVAWRKNDPLCWKPWSMQGMALFGNSTAFGRSAVYIRKARSRRPTTGVEFCLSDTLLIQPSIRQNFTQGWHVSDTATSPCPNKFLSRSHALRSWLLWTPLSLMDFSWRCLRNLLKSDQSVVLCSKWALLAKENFTWQHLLSLMFWEYGSKQAWMPILESSQMKFVANIKKRNKDVKFWYYDKARHVQAYFYQQKHGQKKNSFRKNWDTDKAKFQYWKITIRGRTMS